MKINFYSSIRNLIHSGSCLMLALLISLNCGLMAQETINTTVASTGYTGTNSSGNGFAITFVISNTSGADILITDMGRYGTTAHNGTTSQLWYSSTSLSGTYGTLAGPAWTMAATQTVSGITTSGVNTFNSGMSLLMPAGATWRFAAYTSGANNYSGTGVGTCTPNTFVSPSGVTMYVGDYQIGGAFVGYGATNNPRFFTGFLTFEVLPNGPNDAGAQAFVSPTLPVCSGTFPVTATIKNYGTNAINPVTVNWSVNGAPQTPFTYTSTLDTAGGTGMNTANVTLGNLVINNVPKTVKIWTTNPNGIADTSNLNDTISDIFSSSLSGTYTIGASGADYPTIASAVAALNNFGVCGPTTFLIDDGTYNESISIGTISGSSSVNTITFKSDPTNTALANQTWASTGTVNNFLWRFANGATYITLDSLNLTATSTVNGRVIDFTGTTDHITVRNSVLTSPTTTTTSTFMAVVMNNSGTANMNDDCLFENNQIIGGAYSFYWWGGSTVVLEQNNRFINNSMTNYYYMGMYLYNQNNSEVLGNYFESAGTYTSTTIGYNLYRVYDDGASKIIGNTFNDKNQGGYAIRTLNCDASAANPAIIANNFVSNTNATTTGTIFAIHTGTSSHQKHHHNSTSILAGGVNSYAFYVTNSGTTYPGCEAINNVFSSTGNGRALYVSSANFTSNYNVFNHPNSTAGFYNANYADLAAMQTGASTDANSITVDPIYTNPLIGDLHVANTALNANATPVGILTDIDGELRSVTPDRGADEIVVTFNDASTFGLINPTNPLCSDSALVDVVIVNSGLLVLNTVNVAWSINGITQPTFNWTGSLASAAFDTVSLGLTPFTNGDELMIWTALPNGGPDSNFATDTITYTVLNGLSGSYSIPGDFTSINSAVNALLMAGTCDTVVFNIAPGTYDAPVTITSFARANAGTPVTFRSSTGDSADVIWTNTTAVSTISLEGADYVWFEDLTISNTAASGQNAIAFSGGADYNRVSRSHVIGMSVTNITNSFATIYNAAGIDSYNTVEDNLIENGSYGLYIYGASTVDLEPGNSVIGNTIINSYYMGAYNYFQLDMTFNENVVTSNSIYTTMYGIYFYYANGDLEVLGNHVYPQDGTDGYAYGIYLSNCSGNDPFNRTLIANNILVGGRPGETGLVYGLYSIATATKSFYHNTCIVLDGSSSSRAIFASGNEACDYINNIFAILPTDTSSSNSLGLGNAMYYTGGVLFESDHNNFYSQGGVPIYFNANYSNLASYQAATNNDLNSYDVNPNFADTMQAILCNDTLDATGMGLASVPYDIAMIIRDVTTPDIGAREYVGLGNFTLLSDTLCENSYEVFAPDISQWSVNGIASAGLSVQLSAQSAPVTFNISASFSSVCSVDSNGIPIPITRTGLIRLVPDAVLDSQLHLCADEDVTLVPGGGATATYSWFPTAEFTSQITVDGPGLYSVTKVEDGCQSQASIFVTQSGVIELADAEECANNLPFTVDASIADGTSYNWSDGATTATNSFSATGSYSVTATDNFGCVATDTFELEVIDTPVAVISNDSNNSNIFFFSSTGSQNVGSNASYLWTFGDNSISTDANPSHTYQWNGVPVTYTVKLTITNECGISTEVSTQVTSDPLSVGAIDGITNLNIYPNPSNGLVTIQGDFDASNLSVEVIDLAGRVVMSNNYSNQSANLIELNLQNLAAGSYQIRILNGDQINVGKVILK